MDDNSYDVDNNYTDGDYGDFYRKDGYFYNKKFGDAFKWRDEKGLIIAENTNIKNIYLKEYFKLGFDNFIFTNCTFTDQLHLPSAFHHQLTFKNCIFEDSVYSLNASFSKQIIFENCEFKSSVNFYRTQFCNQVIFHKVKFHNIADFNNATFYNEVSFRGSIFNKKAVFTNTIFNKKADFSKIKVSNNTNGGFYFENNNKTSDTADIIFDDATFNSPIFFNGRCFKGIISFNNTIITNVFNFTDVDFGSKAILSLIKIQVRQIPNAELWINIFRDKIKDRYLLLAQTLNDKSKDIIKNNSSITNNKITKDDENILISRKDTSTILGIPTNTLKTWTARGKSELVFKNDGDQCGYTLASIKEYQKANPNIDKIKNKEEEPVCDYASAIKRVITYGDSYITTTRMMRGNYYHYLPIIENKTIVGIFSKTIESEFTYRKKMHSNLNLQELTIKDMLDVVGDSIEGFLCTKPKTKVKEVKQMFIQDSQYEEGIGVVFLTSNGKADGELVGMVRLKDLIKI